LGGSPIGHIRSDCGSPPHNFGSSNVSGDGIWEAALNPFTLEETDACVIIEIPDLLIIFVKPFEHIIAEDPHAAPLVPVDLLPETFDSHANIELPFELFQIHESIAFAHTDQSELFLAFFKKRAFAVGAVSHILAGQALVVRSVFV
jgi:hypothetical protein